MIPIQLNVNPANHEKLDEWRNACLWKSFDDRELEYFIRDIQKCTIKSGFVLVYDDDGSFKSIPFRAKKIMDPKVEEVVIKVKHLRKNQSITFDEKIDMLNKFVVENEREPTDTDIIEGFNLGKFHTSLKKNRDKYQFFLDNIGKLDEMEIEVEEEDGGEQAPIEAAPVEEAPKDADKPTSCDELVENKEEEEKPKKNKKSKKSKKE